MSSFEDELTKTQFDGIINGMELDYPMLNPADMHTVLLEGEPVHLDVFAGEDLRTQLVTSATDAEAVMSVSKDYLSHTDPTRRRFILDALTDETANFLETKPVTGRVALKGVNVFSVPCATNTRPAIGTECIQELLQEDEMLIGGIHAVTYARFLWAPPEAISEARISKEMPKLAKAWGGILMLTDVKICDTEGIGHVDRTLESVFVPVHKKVFNWYLEAR